MGQSESKCQQEIAKGIYKDGGLWVNGNYTKRGELDLQCGYNYKGRLLYLAIEVKDEKNYLRVMSALREVRKRYKIIDGKKLKDHEYLQVAKVNLTRCRGGLALFAYKYSQVKEHVNNVLYSM